MAGAFLWGNIVRLLRFCVLLRCRLFLLDFLRFLQPSDFRIGVITDGYLMYGLFKGDDTLLIKVSNEALLLSVVAIERFRKLKVYL